MPDEPIKNVNDLEQPHKYVQGSVWHWNNSRIYDYGGVRAKERPAIVVSNNTFNSFSPVVNVVTVTGILKESPTHIPFFVSKDSHIQCEQIHTVPKEELLSFRGLISSNLLTQLQAKLKFQFGIGDDNNAELLNIINRQIDGMGRKLNMVFSDVSASVDLLLEQAQKGFGLPAVEEDFLKVVLDLHSSVNVIADKVAAISVLQPSAAVQNPLDAAPEESPAAENSIQLRPGQKRRRYTSEEKAFIADPNTSIEAVVERFGFTTESAAQKMIRYFRKQLSIEAPRKKAKNRFSEADKAFIIDPDNSIEALLEKFGYNKSTAYTLRRKLRKEKAGDAQ